MQIHAEIKADTKNPIVDLLPEQKHVSDMGGSLRLGANQILPSKRIQMQKKSTTLQLSVNVTDTDMKSIKSIFQNLRKMD